MNIPPDVQHKVEDMLFLGGLVIILFLLMVLASSLDSWYFSKTNDCVVSQCFDSDGRLVNNVSNASSQCDKHYGSLGKCSEKEFK